MTSSHTRSNRDLWQLILVTSAALAVVAIAGYFIWGNLPKGREVNQFGVPNDLVLKPPLTGDFAGKPFDRAEVTGTLRKALAGDPVLRSLPPNEQAQLVDAATRALAAVYSGKLDDYDSLVKELGLEVNSSSDQHKMLRAAWEGSARVVTDQPVNAEKASIRVTSNNGRPEPREIPLENTFSASMRPPEARGPRDVLDAATNGATVAQVRLPSKVVSVDGTAHAGRFGVEMTRRPEDGKWIVTAFVLDNMPQGRPVSLPMP